MAKKPIPIPTKKDPAILAAELKRRSDIVDEFGQLSAEIKSFDPKVKRLEALKKEVRGWADHDFQPHEEVMFEGRLYAVQVSPRGNKRRVEVLKAFLLLGKQKFLEVCSITLKAIEENLGPVEQAKCVVEDLHVGERNVKAMQRAVPAVAKAA